MKTPKPNDDHAALRQALRRDAADLPEPSFDPALHSSTMRRIRALSDREPVRHGWPSARVGMAVASLLILIGWTMPRWHHPANSERFHPTQTYPGQRRGFETSPGNDLAAASPAMEPPKVGLTEDEKAGSASRGLDGAHGSMFADLASFANQRLRYAVLDAGLSVEPAGRFTLDIPTGPIRLNCAYSVISNDPVASLFGRFNFNVSN